MTYKNMHDFLSKTPPPPSAVTHIKSIILRLFYAEPLSFIKTTGDVSNMQI